SPPKPDIRALMSTRPNTTLADFSRARDSQITFSVTHGWSAFWRGRPWLAGRRIGETSSDVGRRETRESRMPLEETPRTISTSATRWGCVHLAFARDQRLGGLSFCPLHHSRRFHAATLAFFSAIRAADSATQVSQMRTPRPLSITMRFELGGRPQSEQHRPFGFGGARVGSPARYRRI